MMGRQVAISSSIRQRLLARSWWILCPAFVLLVGRLSFERACADPYRLLPGLMSQPATAWGVALLYLAAHGWLFAAYLHTAAEVDELWPSRTLLRRVWRTHSGKPMLMAAALAVEYVPVSMWQASAAWLPWICAP